MLELDQAGPPGYKSDSIGTTSQRTEAMISMHFPWLLAEKNLSNLLLTATVALHERLNKSDIDIMEGSIIGGVHYRRFHCMFVSYYLHVHLSQDKMPLPHYWS